MFTWLAVSSAWIGGIGILSSVWRQNASTCFVAYAITSVAFLVAARLHVFFSVSRLLCY